MLIVEVTLLAAVSLLAIRSLPKRPSSLDGHGESDARNESDASPRLQAGGVGTVEAVSHSFCEKAAPRSSIPLGRQGHRAPAAFRVKTY